MQDYLKVLNDDQYKAVTTSSQYVRVIAGAGSGKTRVLTTRIVYAVNDWGIDPSKILAITFTNKAANEMRTRIDDMLPERASKIQISTIHSFCVQVLRQDIKTLGYPRNFTILDQDDQKSIIKEGYKELEIDSKKHNINAILDYVANHKVAEIDAEEALQRAFNDFEKEKAQLYQYYLDRQRQLYALDFDDLLLWTNRLFKTYPTIREKWQKKFQFILVDEFQDIDKVQYEIIRLLSTVNTYVYVVGDPDQTIYTWRGADINIIMNFVNDFKPCETIMLKQNYRSTKTILGAANSLIKYNKNRLEKELFTANDDGSKIIYYKGASDDGEALFVARKIIELTTKDVYEYNDIAILYRSNYLSRSFEKSLMDFKIPYFIYGGVRFYERAEIKDSLSYLRMLTNQDDLSFKKIINVPKRGIGQKTVDNILEAARKNHTSMYEASKTIACSAKTRKSLDELINKIEDWKNRSQELTIEKTLQMVYEESGYRSMLENSDDPKDEERVENVNELINDLRGYMNEYPESTLDDYLQMVALYTDIQSDKDGQFVSLMTVHSAKGLEYPNVFVVGLSDGVFPSLKSMDEGIKGLEEERRLAYVAFTRAKDNLYLTDSMGYNYATSSSKIPSRFIDEIDDEYLKKEGLNPQPTIKVKTFVDEDDEDWPVSLTPKRKKSDIKAGDVVVHDDFGEGIVIKVNGNFGDIAFNYPYMTKTLSLNFPKLHKKEDKD